MSDTSDFLALPMRQFVATTAAKTPTPGGGSVAAVVGSLAAALGEMALAFTRGKKKFAQHEEFHAHLATRLARARGMFEDLVADDVAAFSLYQQAGAMPDGPDKDNASAIALAAAINVPRETAKLALVVLRDLAELADKCNPFLISDLTAAAALAVAVTKLSDYNVRINAKMLPDKAAAADLRAASAGDVESAGELLAQIERATSPLFE